MQSTNREFEDPKIILSTSLLRQKDSIVMMLNAGLNSDALKAMATLITQFVIEATETELLKAKENLIQNTRCGTIKSSEIMYYWELLNDYMNRTYFAEYHKAKPRHQNMPTLKLPGA